MLENKLIINRIGNERNIFLYQDGVLTEQYKEKLDEQRQEGNIYLGKVKDIIKGMQSAFIDIGSEKNALIHIKDLMPKASNTTGNNNVDATKLNITKYVKPNENIIVQVKRDGVNTKGARVTKDIKLVGRFAVIMPMAEFITVSTKIENENEIQRLKKCANNALGRFNWKGGIILRTSAENQSEAELIKDIEELIKLWKNIENKAQNENAPYELYNGNGIVGKLITDFEPQGLEIITNSEEEKNYIKQLSNKVKVEVDSSVDEEFEERKKVWLKCGGFITIDKTEALIAIDVNSGKCLGNKRLEETVFKVNKEAAEEIAKQLRLRDLGGIIIIDFIDMLEEKNRDKITEIMNNALKKDRSKVQIVEFTKLGLLEVTRKNIYRR